jgi:2-polyprenyl-6-hydroxyphenyl methylase/3-demethylubiquinone-9 3-methyltransferase
MSYISSSIDPIEISQFAALASEWWKENGEFKLLHLLNPLRLSFLKNQVLEGASRPLSDLKPLEGLKILDIGCGGGILAEPLTRMGAEVIGIDATVENVEAARLHAKEGGLSIQYLHTSAEELALTHQPFDVVIASEVIEHVADISVFLKACGQLLKPQGTFIVTTINRTLKSYMGAIIGAEYLLRWVPKGTHTWQKFVKPSEIARELRKYEVEPMALQGVLLNPLTQEWSFCKSLDVNYFMSFCKR